MIFLVINETWKEMELYFTGQNYGFVQHFYYKSFCFINEIVFSLNFCSESDPYFSRKEDSRI